MDPREIGETRAEFESSEFILSHSRGSFTQRRGQTDVRFIYFDMRWHFLFYSCTTFLTVYSEYTDRKSLWDLPVKAHISLEYTPMEFTPQEAFPS